MSWQRNFQPEDFETRRSSRAPRAVTDESASQDDPTSEDFTSEASGEVVQKRRAPPKKKIVNDSSDSDDFSSDESDDSDESDRRRNRDRGRKLSISSSENSYDSDESDVPHRSRTKKTSTRAPPAVKKRPVKKRHTFESDTESGDDNLKDSDHEDDDSLLGSENPEYSAPAETGPRLDVIVKRRQTDNGDFEYFCKLQKEAYIHCRWLTIAEINEMKGQRKLENYVKQTEYLDTVKQHATPEEAEQLNVELEMEAIKWERFCRVDRVIATREVPELQVLVKWVGLEYKDATWEYPESIPGFQRKIDECLERRPAVGSRLARKDRPRFRKMKEQPDWVPLPASESAPPMELRDYQLEGINWLLQQWRSDTNVILADEMGLGKTIQCIMFLGCLFKEYQTPGPFLVCVPLSTLKAWKREFSKWTPFLNVVVYIGSRESRETAREYEFYFDEAKSVPKFHVLLSTYEIIHRDLEFITPFKWKSLVVDEAHRLKDRENAIYKDLSAMNSESCVLVTGTPIQNSLAELWCLLHFLDPHKFDSLEDFEDEYQQIAETDQMAVLQTLHGTLGPHLLRRVKKDVEKSLPQKVERILRVPMAPLQVHFYKLILARNFKELSRGLKGKQASLLNIVMELKKCCNHPFLFDNAEEKTDDKATELVNLIKGSGKLILLDKLLIRLKETGHRVLIFSQMVRMLDILADYLRLKNYGFCRLDGTMNSEIRQQQMDQFNAPNSTDFCFLLSTRAGGLGINLATADTVIIFDSDWNPQNDLQAEARAHRIGQKNTVSIYRLLTRDTIEENILERARQKMILDQLVIQQMDTGTNRKKDVFNKKDLAKILQFGAEDIFKADEANAPTEEFDIDAILDRAETRVDAANTSQADAFLSAFKVANFQGDPADDFDNDFWGRTIPENQIPRDQQDDATSVLTAYQRRRAAQSVVTYNETQIFGKQPVDAAPAPAPKKKKSKSKTNYPPSKIARHVYRAVMGFGTRQEMFDFLTNGLLAGMTQTDIEPYVEELIHTAEQAEPDAKTFEVHGVAFGPPAEFLERLGEVEYLVELVERAGAKPNFRLNLQQLPMPQKWDVAWSVVHDSMLMLGVYFHGLNCDQIISDPRLGLEFLQNPSIKIPKSAHLNGRIARILKELAKERTKKQKIAKNQKAKDKKDRKRKDTKLDAPGPDAVKKRKTDSSRPAVVEPMSSPPKSRKESDASARPAGDMPLGKRCGEKFANFKVELRPLKELLSADGGVLSNQALFRQLILVAGRIVDEQSEVLVQELNADTDKKEVRKEMWRFLAVAYGTSRKALEKAYARAKESSVPKFEDLF